MPPYDTRNYKKQENTVFEDYGNLPLSENEKDELLLEFFPTVTRDFLTRQVEEKYLDNIYRIEGEKRLREEAAWEAYQRQSPEEKQARLPDRLYHFQVLS
jgi:oxaloacetate decarboxylase alpha subunit/pyruvate carboxylase subunit B